MCSSRYYIMSGDFPVLFLNSIFVSHQGLQNMNMLHALNRTLNDRGAKAIFCFPRLSGLELPLLPKLTSTSCLGILSAHEVAAY